PHMFLSTSQARAILRGSVQMSDFVWQTANLAGFISGCYTDDLEMIRASLEDVVIEPQRQALIPGFQDVRRGAMEAGALGCSISGAGPSMFAWAPEAAAGAAARPAPRGRGGPPRRSPPPPGGGPGGGGGALGFLGAPPGAAGAAGGWGAAARGSCFGGGGGGGGGAPPLGAAPPGAGG